MHCTTLQPIYRHHMATMTATTQPHFQTGSHSPICIHASSTWDICKKVHNHTLDCILPLPEIFSDRFADEFQDDPSWVKGTKRSDSRDVRCENVSCVHSWKTNFHWALECHLCSLLENTHSLNSSICYWLPTYKQNVLILNIHPLHTLTLCLTRVHTRGLPELSG